MHSKMASSSASRFPSLLFLTHSFIGVKQIDQQTSTGLRRQDLYLGWWLQASRERRCLSSVSISLSSLLIVLLLCTENAARAYGLPDSELFQTVDLFEKRNIPQVTQCIHALGRFVCSSISSDMDRHCCLYSRPRRRTSVDRYSARRCPMPIIVSSLTNNWRLERIRWACWNKAWTRELVNRVKTLVYLVIFKPLANERPSPFFIFVFFWAWSLIIDIARYLPSSHAWRTRDLSHWVFSKVEIMNVSNAISI